MADKKPAALLEMIPTGISQVYLKSRAILGKTFEWLLPKTYHLQ